MVGLCANIARASLSGFSWLEQWVCMCGVTVFVIRIAVTVSYVTHSTLRHSVSVRLSSVGCINCRLCGQFVSTLWGNGKWVRVYGMNILVALDFLCFVHYSLIEKFGNAWGEWAFFALQFSRGLGTNFNFSICIRLKFYFFTELFSVVQPTSTWWHRHVENLPTSSNLLLTIAVFWLFNPLMWNRY